MKMLMATLVLIGALAPQDKPAAPACDLATVEDALWCPKCSKAREKEELEGGQCKVCKSTPEKLKVCVKKWISRCGMHEQKPHLENCCKSKRCCVMETSRSPILYRCTGCAGKAREETQVVHEGPDHDKKLIRTCEASGTAPHGGEPIK